jgi:hypothetical protein
MRVLISSDKFPTRTGPNVTLQSAPRQLRTVIDIAKFTQVKVMPSPDPAINQSQKTQNKRKRSKPPQLPTRMSPCTKLRSIFSVNLLSCLQLPKQHQILFPRHHHHPSLIPHDALAPPPLGTFFLPRIQRTRPQRSSASEEPPRNVGPRARLHLIPSRDDLVFLAKWSDYQEFYYSIAVFSVKGALLGS